MARLEQLEEETEPGLSILISPQTRQNYAMRSARGDRGAYVGASEMLKLQDMIDTVLGDINSQPMPQPKDPSILERERSFAERARKLQMLREARLTAQTKR